MNEITADWLEAADACEDHLALFRETFGERAPLTREAALRAAREGLDLDWFATRILRGTALRAYEEATATALRAYEEATAAARRAYEEATATAWRAYQEAAATALADALGLP